MYEKPNAPSQLLLFADPPNLNELVVVTAKLSKQIVQQSTVVQPQILKCREIIFTEPTITATPAYDVSNAFYVVMEQSLYKTGRLQARFQKIGLEASKPTMVSPAMYQACLRYTLVARIAPNWNKTGEWLIQGRDFLTSNGYVNAVKLDITVNQGEMYFSLDATTVKFLPLHVEDLDIYGNCYKDFLQHHHAEIDESAIGSPWSHVLPSMKKGKVVGVTRTLPQSVPFKSYKDLKRHWKNTYGYRLPESEDGVIYYQVHFRPLGGRIFTYPEVCLRASNIERVPRVDPKPILTAFLQGVQSKMSCICGIPLRLQTKAKYPILELLPPNLQMSKQANLSNRSSSGKVIYRSREEMEIMLNRTHSASANIQSTAKTDHNHPQDSQNQVRVHQLDDNDGIFQSRNQSACSQATMSFGQQSGNNHQKEVTSSTRDPANKVYPDSTLHTMESEQSAHILGGYSSIAPTPTPGSPIVPSFAAKKSHCQNSNTFGSSATSAQKTVPVFKPKQNGTNGSTVVLSSSISSGTAPNGKDIQTRPPIKASYFSEEKPSHGQVYGSVVLETAIAPSIAPSFTHKALSVNPCKGGYTTGQTSQQSSVKFTSSVREPCTVAGPGTPMGTPLTPQTPAFQIPSTPQIHEVTPKGTPRVSEKRPKQDEEGTPKIKKPRVKPQIQENLDVELFARANQLQKANAATLIAWLREKGIQHKSKDKKSDLIDRVNTVLGLGVEP